MTSLQEPSAYEELLAYFPEADSFEKAEPDRPTDEPPVDDGNPKAQPPAADAAADDAPEKAAAPEAPAAAPEATAEIEQLKAQIAELKQQLEEAKPQSAPQTPAATEDPLAHIDTEEQLAAEIERARRITKWATANWDGVGPDGEPTSITNDKGEKVELTAAQVRDYFSRYRDILDYAPTKAQQLRATQELSAQADKVYPELANPKSQESALAAQLLKALPGIRQFPDWKLFVGDWVRGQKLRLEAAQAAAKPKAQPELAPKAPVSKAATNKVPTTHAAQAKTAVFDSAGSKDSLESYFLTTAR